MSHHAQADRAFDDAYRSARILAGDHSSALPDPYKRNPTPTHSRSRHSPPAPAQAAAGGFLIDDADDAAHAVHADAAAAGGFLPDDAQDVPDAPDQPSSTISEPNHIPLSAIPDALANLHLPSNDSDVLDLFASTAYVPVSARRNARPGTVVDKVIGREEFRQVVSVLLSQRDTAPSPAPPVEAPGRSKRPTRNAARKSRAALRQDAADERDDDDSAEEFQDPDVAAPNAAAVAGDDNSELSDVDASYGDAPSKRSRSSASGGGVRRKRRKASTPSSSPSDGQEDGRTNAKTPKLHQAQRDQALAAFELFLERLPVPQSGPSNPAQRRLGVDEIQKVAGAMVEKLSEKDIEEMLSVASALFAPASSPHATRLSAQRAREAAQGAATAFGTTSAGGVTVGLDEFAGVLVKAKLL